MATIPLPMPLRVLIVDDDPVFRLVLSRAIEQMPGVALLGTAANLTLARGRIERGGVDVVLLDVEMGAAESGLTLLKWLRQHDPDVATVLVTAGNSRGARTEVDALLLGAVALVLKPMAGDRPRILFENLSRILAALRRKSAPLSRFATIPIRLGRAERELVVVGASTGGPPVVLKLLQSLPADFDVPMVIVQHMAALHVPYFVGLLSEQSGRHVSLVRHGELIVRGRVYVAGDGKHARVVRVGSQSMLLQDEGPEEHYCRPAVDPLFRSAAEACRAAVIGVVISGMGSDGAAGALALKSGGASVVVQDQATSVVWGMPGAVVAAAAATAVAPANDLASWVTRWTTPNQKAMEGASHG